MGTLLPNPPPMSGEITRILCSGRPVTIEYRVRCACGAWLVAQAGQLPADLVEVRHDTAGLQRRRVDPRVEHVLADRDLGRAEDRVGALGVAGLPVEDVVVGPPGLVVPDQRRPRVQGPARVHHRGQRLVLHVDQLEGVAGGVVVLGHHERHLLALEADLVGGQHGLLVAGQGWHPGQTALFHGLAGEDRLDLRVCLGRDGVDGHDPGVRVRAAQDRAVEHAGELHVVHEGAAAADEALVLLARPRTETAGHRLSPGSRPGVPPPSGQTGRCSRSRCSGRSGRRGPP